MAQYEEGLKANPCSADLPCSLAETYYLGGRPEEAIRRINEAMRLNPNYPGYYSWNLGRAQYFAHDYEGEVKTLRRMSPMGQAQMLLAASLAQLGRMEEARGEADKFLKDNPSFSASRWGSIVSFLHNKARQHTMGGRIKAGLPR